MLVHEDNSTPMAAVNILYNVGARDESPDKTGFAHLFEHLMFGGSANIPDFDDPIQMAGGENNAFTNNDITNFYDILPAQNLETAFWLESDRMFSLNFDEKVLKVQQKVVIEEFKETCLNEPYGDVWHHIADMAFKVHAHEVRIVALHRRKTHAPGLPIGGAEEGADVGYAEPYLGPSGRVSLIARKVYPTLGKIRTKEKANGLRGRRRRSLHLNRVRFQGGAVFF